MVETGDYVKLTHCRFPWSLSQDWNKEQEQGYKESVLADQCVHRHGSIILCSLSRQFIQLLLLSSSYVPWWWCYMLLCDNFIVNPSPCEPYRYKIYIEGSAWSVSQKNILACDSVTLLVKPQYYEFFSRGLMPLQHYWPIRADDKCRSIKHAVEWGNDNEKQVIHSSTWQLNSTQYLMEA